ncbi:MAG TPA: SDR family NAD(P)-dependent oxidoreductase [Bryobacteraceae bacterium]|jgi:3-oxoacyl-[acyl-carrier protein] reductase|nr:SDR family NAD(P)-dependent oxidoreductase [Bryobacteraceae bacterium]
MKTAIVTGSNRGIGKAIATRLAGDGMNVVLCARDEELLNATAKTIGPNALAVAVDLRLPESAQKVVDAAIARFGALDVLVNNAGATKRGDFEALTDEDFHDGFALKYFGAVRMTRAAWPHLRKQSGSLVNIVGAGGRTPGAMFSIGGSVNAAVLSFTKSMSEKGIADGVQVTAINPGPVRTARLQAQLQATNEADFLKQQRIARIGEPEDIAALVAFVLSPHGRLLQGSLIDADGGQTKTI